MNTTATGPDTSPTVKCNDFSILLGSTIEAILHQLLYSRSVYPLDSFVLHRHLGVRCYASRVPQVCEYISDFLSVAIPTTLNGVADSLILIILEEEVIANSFGTEERTGITKTLERFVFNFPLDGDTTSFSKELSSATATKNKMISSGTVFDITDTNNAHFSRSSNAVKLAAELAGDGPVHFESLMRDCLLRILALRGRRKQKGEKSENISFKLCLHVAETKENQATSKYVRDDLSPELTEALKQGRWFQPEISSCLFTPEYVSDNENLSNDRKNVNISRKGLLRPIKSVKLPYFGIRMLIGMEVDHVSQY